MTRIVILVLLFVALPVTATVNNQPIAKAVVSPVGFYACECESVELDGSGSYDLDGWITEYKWTCNSQVFTGKKVILGKEFIQNPGTYRFTLKVTDNGGINHETETVFRVWNNPHPYIKEIRCRYKTEDESSDFLVSGDKISIEVVLVDKEYGRITYSWDYDPEIFRKTGDGSKVTFEVIPGEAKWRTHKIGVTVSNACGDESNRKEVEVEIKPSQSNQSPKAKITLPANVSEGKRFQASSFGSTTGNKNEEGDEIISWDWRITRITKEREIKVKASPRENPRFTLEDSGIFNISLEVTDRFGATGSDFMYFQVNEAENDPPVADASLTQRTVFHGKEFILDGSKSRDPDGRAEKAISWYVWTDTTYNNEEICRSRKPICTAVLNRTGLHRIKLTVIDTGFPDLSENDDIVEVNVIESPTSISSVEATPIATPTSVPVFVPTVIKERIDESRSPKGGIIEYVMNLIDKVKNALDL